MKIHPEYLQYMNWNLNRKCCRYNQPVTSSPGLPYLICGRLQMLEILGGQDLMCTPPLGSASDIVACTDTMLSCK